MKRLHIVLSTLGLALLPAVTRADQLAALSPTQDNTIFSESSNSAGGEIGVFVGSNNAPGIPSRRGLIQFNLAGIPTGATITGASLNMFLEMANNGTARTIDLHRVNVAWGEGTAGAGQLNGAGFTAGTGDATWLENMHSLSSWTAGGDFVSTVSASASISGTTAGTPFAWTSPTLLSDVQGWYANASTNHGWELVSNGEGTGGSVKTFYSKEFSDTTVRPALLVFYYVPEPASMALVASVVPLGLTYRRRKA